MKKRIFGLCLFIFMFCIPAKVQAETLASTIVSDAESYVGKLRYVYGGTSLTTGADCSGFICAIFEKHGYNLWGKRNCLRELPSSVATGITNNINYALPGDILTLTSSSGKHVGIYAGNGYLINAANSREGVVKKTYHYYGSLFAITRINGVVQTLSDTTAPVISDVKVTDVNSGGYTVTCRVEDASGVSRVQFPTWTFANDQDDIVPDWVTNPRCSGTQNGTTWSFRVNASDHNNEEGWYATHIYAYDTAGNWSSAGIDTYVDKTAPVISNVRVTDISSEGYTVTCIVEDAIGAAKVQFPTWTVANDQDDLVPDWCDNPRCRGTQNGTTWSFRVNAGDHYNEEGWYATHIYAYDDAGNYGFAGINAYVDKTAPIISNVRVTDINSEGYTVTCTVEDASSDVARVQFPTWTVANDQDDLAPNWWENPESSGMQNGTIWSFRVNVSDHNNESGLYRTHIYAYDTAGNCSNAMKVTDIYINKTESSSQKPDLSEKDTSDFDNDMSDFDDLENDMTDLNPMEEDDQINETIITMKKLLGKYKIINTSETSREVAFIGTTKKNTKKITIPNTIKYQGITYQVTEISANALKKSKKLQTVKIGSNIIKIGKNVFNGCKNLKSITITSKKINYVGKNAFKNIPKKCRIKVPASKVKDYRKLFL